MTRMVLRGSPKTLGDREGGVVEVEFVDRAVIELGKIEVNLWRLSERVLFERKVGF